MMDPRDKLRKPAAWVCCSFFIAGAVHYIWMFAKHGAGIFYLLLSVFLLVLSYGLFRLYRRALRTAAIILLLLAFIIPLGVINPFAAMDMEATGKGSPSVLLIMTWLIPLEFALLSIAFIIDPVKSKK